MTHQAVIHTQKENEESTQDNSLNKVPRRLVHWGIVPRRLF